MNYFILNLLFFAFLLSFGESVPTDDQRSKAEEKAGQLASGLYITLRNIAFPSRTSADDKKKVDNRFILLLPGKVLNYNDYYPGGVYTDFVQGSNVDRDSPHAVVPPRVMEKWFDIADAIPSYNPLNAQDTGKSLANIYASILHEMKLKGLEAKTASERAIYKEAVDFLHDMVVDPNNTSAKVPRLTLYERYRDLYNDRRLEMEDQIELKRKSVRSIEYELWFQRHYPSLQAKVESAYTKWLIFGEKESVELYITYMDTGSSAKFLEQGRMILRASGVTSLDRTRTIYPVSFQPSDWYEYLKLPELQKRSRDQLQMLYGKLQSKIRAIDVIIETTNNKSASISRIVEQQKEIFIESQMRSRHNVSQYQTTQIDCLESSQCNYETDRENAIEALEAESDQFSTYQFAAYFQNPSNYIAFLRRERDALKKQSLAIINDVEGTSPYLGGILGASKLQVADIDIDHRNSQWLQFDYDSETYNREENRESTVESISVSTRFRFFFFSGGGSYSSTKSTSDYNEKLANSRLRVKGELLRVNIKRPWFKPEIFDIPDITFKQSGEGEDVFVAPGRDFTEPNFLNEVNYGSKDGRRRSYKLPEYTTGFLLARKIEMEFSGVDSEVVTSTMHKVTKASGSGGFAFFRVSASYSKTRQTSHVSVKKTTTGMSISVPGAQIIGYYTQVMPRFPQNQD